MNEEAAKYAQALGELRRLCEFIEAGQHMAAHVQAAALVQKYGWRKDTPEQVEE